MLVRTAKAIAKGQKITKVVTWDSMGQHWGAPILTSDMILSAETGRYHEDGDTDEDGYVLSTVLNTDAVLEIWTAAGKAWATEITTVEGLVGE